MMVTEVDGLLKMKRRSLIEKVSQEVIETTSIVRSLYLCACFGYFGKVVHSAVFGKVSCKLET